MKGEQKKGGGGGQKKNNLKVGFSSLPTLLILIWIENLTAPGAGGWAEAGDGGRDWVGLSKWILSRLWFKMMVLGDCF